MAAKKKIRRKPKRKAKSKYARKQARKIKLRKLAKEREEAEKQQEPPAEPIPEPPPEPVKKESEESIGTILKKQNPNINHRHKALSLLHNQTVGLEVRLQRELYQLEELYTNKYFKPLHNLRKVLLHHRRDRETSKEDEKELIESFRPSFADGSPYFGQLKLHLKCLLQTDHGLPSVECENFWLNVFLRSDPIVRELITPPDLDRLNYLHDVRTKTIIASDKGPLDSLGTTEEDEEGNSCPKSVGFELQFEFRRNPHFSNSLLTKRYIIDLLPEACDVIIANHSDIITSDYSEEWDADGEDSDNGMTMSSTMSSRPSLIGSDKMDKLLEYNGPEVVRVTGCNIHWLRKQDKNRSLHVNGKFVRKEKSFFDFFNVSWNEKCPDHPKEVARDYRIASYIKDVIITRAYAFYRRSDWKEKDAESPDQHVAAYLGKRYDNTVPSSSDVETPKSYDDIDEEIPMALMSQALQTIQSSKAIKKEIFYNNKLTASRLARSSICSLTNRRKTGSEVKDQRRSSLTVVDDEFVIPPQKFSSLRDVNFLGSLKRSVTQNIMGNVRENSEEIPNTTEFVRENNVSVNPANMTSLFGGIDTDEACTYDVESSPVTQGNPMQMHVESKVCEGIALPTNQSDEVSASNYTMEVFEWSDYSQQPSINRAYEKLKYNLKTKLGQRTSESFVETTSESPCASTKVAESSCISMKTAVSPCNGADCHVITCCLPPAADDGRNVGGIAPKAVETSNPDAESSTGSDKSDSGFVVAQQPPSGVESECDSEERMWGFGRPDPTPFSNFVHPNENVFEGGFSLPPMFPTGNDGFVMANQTTGSKEIKKETEDVPSVFEVPNPTTFPSFVQPHESAFQMEFTQAPILSTGIAEGRPECDIIMAEESSAVQLPTSQP